MCRSTVEEEAVGFGKQTVEISAAGCKSMARTKGEGEPGLPVFSSLEILWGLGITLKSYSGTRKPSVHQQVGENCLNVTERGDIRGWSSVWRGFKESSNALRFYKTRSAVWNGGGDSPFILWAG